MNIKQWVDVKRITNFLARIFLIIFATQSYAQDSTREIIERSNKILDGQPISGSVEEKPDTSSYAKTMAPQIDDRIQGLKSGRIKVASLQDAEIKFDALKGRPLISSPKVKPDGKNYSVDGFLEKYTNTTFIATFVPAQVIGSMPFNTRFVVLVPPAFQTSYQNTARVGVGLRLIGKYVGNKELPLVTGASVTVPVFEMLYLD